mmetsp:Transcript_48213/g.153904  ORF Transcript_48213/g.153904 Transcript_48213/m.153904 type:complete len:418 (-) Transcript_48213:53-1306(-)
MAGQRARQEPAGQEAVAASADAEAEELEWEPDVLPVFYYNDLLVSGIGENLGLNLFEPRYQEMCRRMATDPRFLFMPNYEDYSCRVGDVGFVIKITDIRPQRHGEAYGIRGRAQELAAVRCTWVEPGTKGLHHAQYWRLNAQADVLSSQELSALYGAMRQRGWLQADDADCRALLRLPEERVELLLGANWPDRFFLLLPQGPSGSTEKAQQLLQEAWAAAVPSLPYQRLRAGVSTALQRVSGVLEGPQLATVCESLLRELRGDGAVGGEEGLTEGAWRALLAEARLCSVGDMGASLPTVRLSLCRPRPDGIEESFPRSQLEGAPGVASVLASNETNVYFFANLASLRVTAESAGLSLAALTWRLNRLRLRLLYRAREAGCGPLAALNENAAQLVCDFVATRPRGARSRCPALPGQPL